MDDEIENGKLEIDEEETSFYEPKKINHKEMDLMQGLFDNTENIDLMDGYSQRMDKTKIGFGGSESYGKKRKKDINVFKTNWNF